MNSVAQDQAIQELQERVEALEAVHAAQGEVWRLEGELYAAILARIKRLEGRVVEILTLAGGIHRDG